MAAEREPPSISDYVVTAIGPALIMLMVGSLVFFLVEVLYEGKYSDRLLYKMFFFVSATVLVARISIQSDAGRAVFVTSAAASTAPGYLGPYAASKAALEALVRVWANETASTPLRVNLFDPGPIRTRMRATVFPGEDPMTLDTPEQVAEFIVPMCTPDWSETGKLFEYRTRRLLSFRGPA